MKLPPNVIVGLNLGTTEPNQMHEMKTNEETVTLMPETLLRMESDRRIQCFLSRI